jgi:hypothetical protein
MTTTIRPIVNGARFRADRLVDLVDDREDKRDQERRADDPVDQQAVPRREVLAGNVAKIENVRTELGPPREMWLALSNESIAAL